MPIFKSPYFAPETYRKMADSYVQETRSEVVPKLMYGDNKKYYRRKQQGHQQKVFYRFHLGFNPNQKLSRRLPCAPCQDGSGTRRYRMVPEMPDVLPLLFCRW